MVHETQTRAFDAVQLKQDRQYMKPEAHSYAMTAREPRLTATPAKPTGEVCPHNTSQVTKKRDGSHFSVNNKQLAPEQQRNYFRLTLHAWDEVAEWAPVPNYF